MANDPCQGQEEERGRDAKENEQDVSSESGCEGSSCKSDTCEFLEVPSHVFVVEGCQVPESEDGHQSDRISSETKFSLTSLSSESEQNMYAQKGFRIQTLKSCLESCIREDTGEVDLDRYLATYKEICKLLDNLGTVIRTNIGKDIKMKIEIMMEHKNGPNGAFYHSLEKMITFEKIKKIHQKNPDENGSRTILILHRSLNFIIEFLRSLNSLRVEQGVGSIGRDAYNRTLAPFHPWGYRHIARLALSSLGRKGQFIANFHDGSMSLSQVHEMVEDVVNVASQVYNRCHSIYEKTKCLNLP